MWWRYRPLHSNTHDGICCYGVVDVLRQDAQHGLANLHTGLVAGDPTKLLLFLAFMLAWHRCHRRPCQCRHWHCSCRHHLRWHRRRHRHLCIVIGDLALNSSCCSTAASPCPSTIALVTTVQKSTRCGKLNLRSFNLVLVKFSPLKVQSAQGVCLRPRSVKTQQQPGRPNFASRL